MKFLDLKKEYIKNKYLVDKAVIGVLESGSYLLGDYLSSFEKAFSIDINIKNSVALKNCTDALIVLIKKALDIKGKKAPIILPNFSAYPTFMACRSCSENLYYVDVDRSFTIDVNNLPDIKNGVVVAVHLFGNAINERLIDYTKTNNHIFIEDAAQAAGLLKVGHYGDYAAFSFYPTKPLGAMGDGGMVSSNLDLDFVKKYRFYGLSGYKDSTIGVNSRMDEIQASILMYKLKKYRKSNDKRKDIASRYEKIFPGQYVNNDCIYHQYVIDVDHRDEVITKFKKYHVPFMIHYPFHGPDFEVLRGVVNYVGNRLSERVLSLPIHPYLEEDEIARIEELLFNIRDYRYAK